MKFEGRTISKQTVRLYCFGAGEGVGARPISRSNRTHVTMTPTATPEVTNLYQSYVARIIGSRPRNCSLPYEQLQLNPWILLAVIQSLENRYSRATPAKGSTTARGNKLSLCEAPTTSWKVTCYWFSLLSLCRAYQLTLSLAACNFSM